MADTIRMSKNIVIRTEAAPSPFQGAPYSQAIKTRDLVFVSGQLGLKAAGSNLDQIVKTTVFLVNLSDFGAMNEVYAEHVGENRPARSTVEIGALPSGALVEIEAIATV